MDLDIHALPTPCYLVDGRLLEKNLEALSSLQQRTGCKVLLALKAFSMFSVFQQASQRLVGVTASSLNEARLGREEFGGEVHAYAAAWRDDEFDDLASCCDHIVFNSFNQWERFRGRVQNAGKPLSCGIRVNPGYSEVSTPLYDPCAINSRLGVPASAFRPDELDGIEGLHFHALCEQGLDTLERVWESFEQNFGTYLKKMKWVNLGGGHLITRSGYDMESLTRLLITIREKYGLQVYLEPGEAVAYQAGYLVSTVLDIVQNGMDIAILDTSAACHMPDVLEMPYRPVVIGAGESGEFEHAYRLGGPTCLAGDVIGDYSFPKPLQLGDRLVFCDMAHYTMVKNNTFNGINLPAIALYDEQQGMRVIKQFGYEDFKSRLS